MCLSAFVVAKRCGGQCSMSKRKPTIRGNWQRVSVYLCRQFTCCQEHGVSSGLSIFYIRLLCCFVTFAQKCCDVWLLLLSPVSAAEGWDKARLSSICLANEFHKTIRRHSSSPKTRENNRFAYSFNSLFRSRPMSDYEKSGNRKTIDKILVWWMNSYSWSSIRISSGSRALVWFSFFGCLSSSASCMSWWVYLLLCTNQSADDDDDWRNSSASRRLSTIWILRPNQVA